MDETLLIREASRCVTMKPSVCSACIVQGSGFRVQGSVEERDIEAERLLCLCDSGFMVQGCRVQGAGFRVQGSGFRVQGSGFKNEGKPEFRVNQQQGKTPPAACVCVAEYPDALHVS